jgi:hypothetical protein
VSKESRRAARAARESRRLGVAGAGRPTPDAGTTSESPTAGAAGTPGSSGGAGTRRPAPPATRAGRRERVRRYHEPTFLERYRSLLIGVAAVAVLAVVVGVVFVSATQPVYACSNMFDPSPTPTVSPGSSTRLGFPEENMGNSHIVSRPQKYLFCPPASGNHINAAGQGPIAPRVYKPGDNIGPPNWVHNLEHGGLVVLYRNDSPGATAEGLKAFQDFYNAFPASPICKIPAYQVSPVIARFDSMPHPYAVLVWGRVLYMDTWDPALALRFYNEEDERLDKDGALIQPPEDVFGCGAKLQSASPAAAESSAPSVAPSDVPSAPSSPAPSASPEPSPAPS